MGTGAHMSDITWIILAIVLVAVLVAALLMVLRKNKQKQHDQQRHHAQELRHEADTRHAGGLTEAQREAQEADARAQLARAEAERAEARKHEAEQGLAQQDARREDVLREADRLDPDVDHTSKDYAPGSSPTGTQQTAPVADPDTPPHAHGTEPGTHRREV